MLLALSSGHKLGLALAAAVLIAFALASAFLLPRSRPDFPGRSGLRLFIPLALALFVGMLVAVEFFGRESEKATAEAGAPGGRVAVTETEYKIKLGSESFSPGSYTFELKNAGRLGHDLTITGPNVGKAATPVIDRGQTATLEVTLRPGTYELYCSVPGHKELGMDLKITVS